MWQLMSQNPALVPVTTGLRWQTLMPTYPTGCRGVSRLGSACSSRGWFTITLVATPMKSVPTVLEMNGNERDARRLHSITCERGIWKDNISPGRWSRVWYPWKSPHPTVTVPDILGEFPRSPISQTSLGELYPKGPGETSDQGEIDN